MDKSQQDKAREARRVAAMAQIPASGGTFPTPAPDGRNTTELSRNVGNTLMALPGAAPAMGAISTLARSVPVIGKAITATGLGAANAGAMAAKAAPYAVPAGGLAALSAASSPAPVATPPASPVAILPAQPVASPASPAAAAMGTPVAAPAGALPAVPSGAVKRIGNSYSGANVSGDITVNGKAPTGGIISAQNNLAAENLARRYGQTSGFGPSGAIRGGGTVSSLDTSAGHAQNLKELAAIEATKAEQNANMQAQEEYAAANTTRRRGMSRAARELSVARINDATTRRGQDRTAANQGAIAKLAQEKFGLDSQGTKIDNEQKQLTMGLLKTLLDPKATPEQKAQATAQMQAIAGKTPQEKYTVVPGGQAIIDGQSVTQPSMLFDNATKQFINPNQGGQGGIQSDQRAIAIRDNPNLSREQKVAELKKIGFQ